MQSVYGVVVEKCPKCNGNGLIPVQGTENLLEECVCQIKAKFNAYLGPELLKASTLTSTKLLDHLKSKTSLCIECEDPRAFKAHLETALLHRKDITKSWKIVTPDELMALSFGEDKIKLYSSDLLIIQAPAFPWYETAARQHEYVISTRNGMNKPTWFILKSRQGLIESKSHKLDTFGRILKGLPLVRITLAETLLLVKQPKTASVSIMQGLDMKGIDPELLNFYPEMNARVRKIQRKFMSEEQPQKLAITGMTLSLDIKDLSYGAGQSRFFNMKAEAPEGTPGIPISCIDKLVDQSLDMHLAMWESITSAKYIAGELPGSEALSLIKKARIRVERMKEALQKLSNESKEAESE